MNSTEDEDEEGGSILPSAMYDTVVAIANKSYWDPSSSLLVYSHRDMLIDLLNITRLAERVYN